MTIDLSTAPKAKTETPTPKTGAPAPQPAPGDALPSDPFAPGKK
jgi:hypothetical protein